MPPEAIAGTIIAVLNAVRPNHVSVAATWTVTLETAANPAMERLLQLWAHFEWCECADIYPVPAPDPERSASEGPPAAATRAPAPDEWDGSLGEALLRGLRATFGPDHRHVITAKGHLAATALSLSAYDAARPLWEDVLGHARRILGEAHPHTVRAARYLAETMRGQGDDVSARKLLKEICAAARQTLGDNHPDAVSILRLLARNSFPDDSPDR